MGIRKPAVDLAMAVAAAALLLCFGVAGVASDAFNHRYKKGDHFPLYVNKVGPFHNPSETYRYFDLPFCTPEHVTEKKEALGEVLNGDRLVDAPYKLDFITDQESELLCKKNLSKTDVAKFRSAVSKDYYFQMYYDDLPLWGFIGKVDKEGKDVGEYKYFLYQRFHFEVLYNNDRVIEITVHTDPNSMLDVTEDKNIEVVFVYSVKWKDTTISFEKRMEKYAQTSSLPHHLEIHWFSIINSCVTVLLLIGFLATILMRVLKNDFVNLRCDCSDWGKEYWGVKAPESTVRNMSWGSSYASSKKMESDRLPDKFPVGMKILLVDDDLTCLAVVKRMLLNCQYDVTTCAEATRALSLLRENKGVFDLIISDVHMPDMDGFRLLELVGLEMDLPVILMSGDTRFHVVMKGVSHGACDFLSKPVRMEELQNIWQHVVRRKWLDNKDIEHSGSVEESELNRNATDDSEYASTVNDGRDSSWKYQKKKRDAKEDDDGELDSVDPSSSKKPRVVWSVELHQQFVNAVNQLGIDKAVPKRILELMNVPGLTRENVASHLQKFRLYLKRLSGVAHHQNGLTNTLCGAKVDQLGRLDFQTPAVSGQISPETLAALQDELLGRPSCSLSIPSIDQPVVQQVPIQGKNCVSFEHGIAFGPPLLKGQALSSFPVWSWNNLGVVTSSSKNGGLNASQNNALHMTKLAQPHSQTAPSESNQAVNVQPSCLVAQTKPSNKFQLQVNTTLFNQDSVLVPSESSGSYQAGNAVTPLVEDSVIVSPQSSTSVKIENNNFTNLRSITFPSQSSISISVGNNPGLLNKGSVVIPSQQINKSQGDYNSFLVNQNSLIVPSQPAHKLKTEKDVYVNNNMILNKDSSHINYNRMPKSNVVTSSMEQIIDRRFHSLATLVYSVPDTNTLDIYSSIGSNASWQLNSPEIMIGQSNGSSCVVHDSCNFQVTDAMSRKLLDKGKGNNHDFVSKSTYHPSRLAVDDIESLTSELTDGITYTGEDANVLNQDIYGALQN